MLVFVPPYIAFGAGGQLDRCPIVRMYLCSMCSYIESFTD